MLILTDGQPVGHRHPGRAPADRGRPPGRAGTRPQGIYTYCISLDPKADEYVSDIFGRQYTVIDNIQRLPERLPQLFMALTK